MKRRFSLILSVLFFFAIQMQSLNIYAHINCDHQHTQGAQITETTEHSHHDHESDSASSNAETSKEQKTEACNHQHHGCQSASSAFQAPKLQSQFLNIDLISSNFPSSNELAIEAPVLEGPFQPPRA